MKPFTIDISQSALQDLKDRLNRTRWTDAIRGRGWGDGADIFYMRELCAYWADGFDWREQERRLNTFPQFTAEVAGNTIHFIHVRGKGPNPLPVVVTHGWPSTFAEFTKLIPMLADPVAHGGTALDAFDVIVPSMPGYGFSSRPLEPGMTSVVVADLWASLMSDVLGYDRFVAQGGDIGAGVTNLLGRKHRGTVAAIHAMSAPAPIKPDNLSDAERALSRWARSGNGMKVPMVTSNAPNHKHSQ